MASKPESKLQNDIQKRLKSKGAWVLKTHGGPFQRKGIPDLLVCYNGVFIGMEVKLPNKLNTLTELQRNQLRSIKESGGIACVVTSVNGAEKILDKIKFHKKIQKNS